MEHSFNKYFKKRSLQGKKTQKLNFGTCFEKCFVEEEKQRGRMTFMVKIWMGWENTCEKKSVKFSQINLSHCISVKVQNSAPWPKFSDLIPSGLAKMFVRHLPFWFWGVGLCYERLPILPVGLIQYRSAVIWSANNKKLN